MFGTAWQSAAATFPAFSDRCAGISEVPLPVDYREAWKNTAMMHASAIETVRGSSSPMGGTYQRAARIGSTYPKG